MTVVVRRAASDEELRAALELRRIVFVDEQGVSPQDEWDGRDGDAVHVVAVEDGVVVATCRLLPAGDTLKLGRMAVAASARRRGIALQLLQAADALARETGATRIRLAAQTYAEPLYARAGYVPYGDVFVDAGLEHVRMEKPVA